MKSAKGYTKENYTTRCEKSGGTVIHFESMKNAVEYYRILYPQRTESEAEKAIRNDTNCDWIVFDDGSVLICEYSV